MWNPLYDFLVQLFAGLRWSAFIAQNGSSIVMATKMRNVFRNDLYSMSGWLTLLITFIMICLYYFVVNRKGGAGYGFKPKYWLMFLGGNSLLIILIILYVSVKMTGVYSSLNPFKYSLALAFTNLLYSSILFFALSLIAKRASVASTTPF